MTAIDGISRAGTTPCWEVSGPDGPPNDEWQAHHRTRDAAQGELEDFAAESYQDAVGFLGRSPLYDAEAAQAFAELLDGPDYHAVLVQAEPCWTGRCIDCEHELENYDTGGHLHLPTANAVREHAEGSGWQVVTDGPHLRLLCEECVIERADAAPGPDRTPGPGQLDLTRQALPA